MHSSLTREDKIEESKSSGCGDRQSLLFSSSLNKKKRDCMCSQGGAIKPKGVFQLSELTGQTLSAVMTISLLIKLPTQISQILNGMQEGDNVSAKNLEKSRFPCQNDWCGYGPASQFWQMERALIIYYKTLRTNMLYVPGLQSIIFLYFFCNQNLYFL